MLIENNWKYNFDFFVSFEGDGEKQMHINKEVATFSEEKIGKVIGHNNIYLKNKSHCLGDMAFICLTRQMTF